MLLTVLALAALQGAPDAISLERVAADPEWIARSPERAWWSDDGAAVYYRRDRAGSELDDLWRLDVATGEAEVVADDALWAVDWPGTLDRARTRLAWAHEGDLWVRDLATGRRTQVTRTYDRESSPVFLLDGSLAYRRGGDWFVRDLATDLERQPFDLRTEDDPLDEDEGDDDFLAAQQARLFEFVRERDADREARRRRERELWLADPTRPPLPWYLGDGARVVGAELSPDGRFVLATLADGAAPRDGRVDSMPVWITESSFVEPRDVRPHVGDRAREPQRVELFDLERRRRLRVDLAALPGIADDPLAELRAAQAAREEEADEDADEPDAAPEEAPAADAAPAEDAAAADGAEREAQAETEPPGERRPVSIRGVQWSPDGARVAFRAHSHDNKDRWLVVVEVAALPEAALPEAALPETALPETEEGAADEAPGDVAPVVVAPVVAHHLHDPAWVNGAFGDAGWLDDGRLWFLSEETGWSHLYAWDPAAGATTAVTAGEYEVSDPELSRDGKTLLFRANAEHPGRHELWRWRVDDGAPERLTEFRARASGALSPDGERLLVTLSRPFEPPDLWLQAAEPGAGALRLTDTVEPEFRALPWVQPEFVAVPTPHGAPVHARLTLPPTGAPDAASDGGRPAVIFVHGSGYLQNAHQGWSQYVHETLFHSALAHRGVVVLDPDYRASAGYGRDWRTAIYRDMGAPELEDLLACVDWLAAEHGVDPDRVGIYGGSYGGFLTLTALFRAPGRFAAGAALRPVTDWAHYNDGYTANILNTPDLDPEAYARSSPIEYAEGLQDPLLICHGLVDDNVLAKDSLRLAQRLIELRKTDWELALFPVEPHGFRAPDSWYDEYRRILTLFERELGF